MIVIAICLKVLLFLYAAFYAPEMKMRIDSHAYLDSSQHFFPEGIFGKANADGSIDHEFYRTPGYPLFLGIFHDLLRIPLNGIILLQILLTVLSAVIIYRAANMIGPKLGLLAFLIILFDPAITIHSLMILTESLYLFLMSLFTYAMIIYFREHTKKHLFLSAVLLAAATYVRPISFYLGGIVALFILFSHKNGFKQSLIHACLFTVSVYSLLFLWQWRNHEHYGKYQFSSISNATVHSQGLYKSYERNEDPYSQGLSPAHYYINVSTRTLMSLMTRPASFKYFGSDALKKCGKLFSYPWIVFWLVGLLFGMIKAGENIPLYFLLVVMLYFAAATILGAMWGAGARFRIPMMPYIAILSSYGWLQLKEKYLC